MVTIYITADIIGCTIVKDGKQIRNRSFRRSIRSDRIGHVGCRTWSNLVGRDSKGYCQLSPLSIERHVTCVNPITACIGIIRLTC